MIRKEECTKNFIGCDKDSVINSRKGWRLEDGDVINYRYRKSDEWWWKLMDTLIGCKDALIYSKGMTEFYLDRLW